MNHQLLITLIIVLALLLTALFGLLFSYYYLLRRIAIQFPKYYHAIGTPFLPTASREITKTINRDSFNYALLNRLFTGPPSDFPADATLHRLARYVQLELLTIVLLIAVFLGVLFSA